MIIEHPNRKKASSKFTRAMVVLLLLASAALVAIITVGGWDALEGAKPLQIVLIVLYLVLAVFVLRWSRGVLPVAAALATVLLIFAAVVFLGERLRPLQVLGVALAVAGVALVGAAS